MTGVRVALQIDRLRQPLRKALHTAGRLAYDGVQINARGELRAGDLTDTGLRQLRKMLDDLNLRVSAVSLPTRSGIASSDRIDGRVAAIQQAMQMASRMQSRLLLTNLGALPTEENFDLSTLHDVIDQLSALGRRIGVELALCASDTPPNVLARLLEGLPSQTVGLELNPAQLIAGGEDPRNFVERLGRYIAHVCATDAVSGAGAQTAERVELGRGSAEFPELLGRLEEHEYRGWVTVSPRDTPDVEAELANALQFLRSL